MRVGKNVNGMALPPGCTSVLALTEDRLRPPHHRLETRIPSPPLGKKRQQAVLRFGQHRVTLTPRPQLIRVDCYILAPALPRPPNSILLPMGLPAHFPEWVPRSSRSSPNRSSL